MWLDSHLTQPIMSFEKIQKHTTNTHVAVVYNIYFKSRSDLIKERDPQMIRSGFEILRHYKDAKQRGIK